MLRVPLRSPAIRSGLATLIVFLVVALAIVVLRIIIRSDQNQLLNPPTIKEWIAVGLFIPLTAFMVWWTRFYRRWMFWRKPTEEHTLTNITATIVALCLMIEMFVAVTALAAQTNVIPMTGEFGIAFTPSAKERAHQELIQRETGFGRGSICLLSGPYIYETDERFFGWTLLDAVPVLRVPSTLGFKKPNSPPADIRGGLIILVFKILVILPFLTFARSF